MGTLSCHISVAFAFVFTVMHFTTLGKPLDDTAPTQLSLVLATVNYTQTVHTVFALGADFLHAANAVLGRHDNV